jgi:hypothetical protein
VALGVVVSFPVIFGFVEHLQGFLLDLPIESLAEGLAVCCAGGFVGPWEMLGGDGSRLLFLVE